MTQNEEMRDAFEKWERDNGYDMSSFQEDRWAAWQAARTTKLVMSENDAVEVMAQDWEFDKLLDALTTNGVINLTQWEQAKRKLLRPAYRALKAAGALK